MKHVIRLQKRDRPMDIVRCGECKHWPKVEGGQLVFPDRDCPALCEDFYYSWVPAADWFCANGERKETDEGR